DDKRVFIFEGFFDFLSFLEINNYPNFNYIILNSTANLSKLFDYLFNGDFEEIHLYLDNDLSGNNCTNEIISRYNSSVIDHRIEYRNFNDLNDFLINSIK
ncbi:toprim domain-containing protein, partial [Empedobacter sp.]